jgi:hypothetical protein
MIINSRSTNFWFLWGKSFFPEAVVTKYTPYIKRHYTPYDSMDNFMSSSIQSLTFPTLTMDPVQQTRLYGKKQEYKSSVPVKDLINREITLTMKSFEGYINYWIFMETMLAYLDFAEPTPKMYFDDFQLRLLDQEGRVVNSCAFKGVYFKGLSEISLSYSDNNPEFRTFNATFGYFEMKIFIEND